MIALVSICMQICLISFLFFSFSISLFANTSSVCLDHPKKIQVATYNLLSLHTWKSQWLPIYPPWQQRMTSIASWVKKNNLDILGTQEGLSEMLELLKKDLPDYKMVGKARSQDKEVAEHSALFINQNRYEVLNSGDFWLSKTPDVPGSRSWDSRYPRVCTWAELKDKKDNSRLFVFNAHYDHWGFYSRSQSTKIILERIKKIAGDEKVIVMGDFNVGIGSSSIEAYAKHFLESRKSSQSQAKGRPRSFFLGTIDHIYVSPSMKVCSYEIMEPQSPNNQQLSDHLPVVVSVNSDIF